MTQKEKELFLSLCSFVSPNKEKIEKLICKGAATPQLLGYLFANRMAGVAYGVLEKTELLSCVDREFRNSLRGAYVLNEKTNSEFFSCLNYLSAQLNTCAVPYAMLKGAYLCGKYPSGFRTSCDIDILINPEDIGTVSAKLKEAGFKQGYIRNGKFVQATRQQIIQSKMTRGETVPFIKEILLPYIKYLEVDLNFSLDYKNSDSDLSKKMLDRAQTLTVKSAKIRTLCPQDFFLHLCAHLYKEATTLPWIEMKRDMTFYKYCDIYMLISQMSDREQNDILLAAQQFGLEKELAYCLNSINSLFEIPHGKLWLYIAQRNVDDMTEVISPADKKTLRYTEKDVRRRFFTNDRTKLLREVII